MPRAKSRCSQIGCDQIAPCPDHLPSNRRQASSTARGYGADHRAERESWAPMVATGRVTCRRGKDCKNFPDTLIHRGQPWQLGHPDEECPTPTAPEHRRCNVGAPSRIRGKHNRRT